MDASQRAPADRSSAASDFKGVLAAGAARGYMHKLLLCVAKTQLLALAAAEEPGISPDPALCGQQSEYLDPDLGPEVLCCSPSCRSHMQSASSPSLQMSCPAGMDSGVRRPTKTFRALSSCRTRWRLLREAQQPPAALAPARPAAQPPAALALAQAGSHRPRQHSHGAGHASISLFGLATTYRVQESAGQACIHRTRQGCTQQNSLALQEVKGLGTSKAGQWCSMRQLKGAPECNSQQPIGRAAMHPTATYR